ncbi:hypothetical protein BU16DRAFT_568133 [Lophium mytilinum]|uniref:F-box domain-containing protein n=1 Tax=Lophium mytilinum TaxID=390894 RepID=A0A6A6Q977_9PEZI|nr:hypothetical protein BU16DRAFT_568133 [Lophium mytilinum]
MRVECAGGPPQYGNMGIDINPWIRLPSLQSFESLFFDIGDDLFSDPSDLMSFDLYGGITYDSLSSLLENCPRLKSFGYHFDPELRKEKEIEGENWASCHEALHLLQDGHCDTLERLKIRYYDPFSDDDEHEWHEEEAPWHFPISCFENLKVLEIQAPFILGTDRNGKNPQQQASPDEYPQLINLLPSTITELRLHNCGMIAQEQISALSKAKLNDLA